VRCTRTLALDCYCQQTPPSTQHPNIMPSWGCHTLLDADPRAIKQDHQRPFSASNRPPDPEQLSRPVDQVFDGLTGAAGLTA
jgi:hypothetical protein